jgi:hypothetical protein
MPILRGSLNRGFNASLALVISIMTVTAVLVLPDGTLAADTSDIPIVSISGAVEPPAGNTFYDVAWRPDGTYALFVGHDVGTGMGCIYRYDPLLSGDAAWQMLFVSGSDPTVDVVRSVVYDPWDDMFVAVGDDDNSPYAMCWYAVNYGCTNIWEYTHTQFPQYSYGTDLVLDTYANRILCVGYKGPSVGATVWAFTPLAQTWSLLFSGGDDESWFTGGAVHTSGDIYVVGANYASPCGLYYRYSSGVATWLGPGGTWNSNDFIELIFSDIAYLPSADAMVLSVESRTSGVQALYYAWSWTGFETLNGLDSESDPYHWIYKDLEYDPRSGYVFVAGYESWPSNVGRVHAIWYESGRLHLAMKSDDGAAVQGHAFLSISVRPARIPMALVAGSAFVYHYTSADSGIQVNVAAPHINFVDIYAAGTSTSYINSPVDIDDGSNTIGYDVTLSAYHSAGQGYITNVELSLWRDTGASESMPAGFINPGYGNVRARFVWNRGSPDSWSVICPTVTGSEEITLVPAQCSRVDEMDGQNVTIKFRVYFHQQARYALGPFTEAPGVRNANQQMTTAFNNLNSWNLWMHALDTGGQIDYAYDEFGMYQYTYIGASGLPGGGAISGSGAPGQPINLNPPGDITYSANCPYRLSGAISDLTGQILLGTIPATSFSVNGGNLSMTAITGPGVPVYFYGSGVPTYQSPLDSGRTTTTSTGDFNGDADPVTWYCTIPAALEDRYVGTITYTISHG